MGKMNKAGQRAWQKRATINKILDLFKAKDGSQVLSHRHIYEAKIVKGKLKVSFIRGAGIVQVDSELVPFDEVTVLKRADDA